MIKYYPEEMNAKNEVCQFMHPGREKLKEMQNDCVEKWMYKMAQGDACEKHFAKVASPDCNANDLTKVCSATADLFTKRDAENLCSRISLAHQSFWPEFWKKAQS